MAVTGSVTVVTRNEPVWKGACIALIVIGVILSGSLLTTYATLDLVDQRGQRIEAASAAILERLEVIERSLPEKGFSELAADLRSILLSQRTIWDSMRGVTATYEEGGLTGPREIYKQN